MQKVPNDLGQRIIEATKLAVSLHLKRVEKEAADRRQLAPFGVGDLYPARLPGLVGDILPSREAA